MAKQKQEGREGTAAESEGNAAPFEANAQDDDLKRAGGRTIARWKEQVFKDLPQGSDQEIAERLNRIAHEEGYDYQCTPAAVARWRQAEGAVRRPSTASDDHEEGHAYVVLRQLVYLLGKDAVKKLVDSV